MALPKKGATVRRKKDGAKAEVLGFTTKPDGVRKARLKYIESGRETKVANETFTKNFEVC